MIKLFSTGCPKCKALEMKLTQENKQFDIESNKDIVIAKGKEIGILSAPILEVDGKYYDFVSAIKFLKEDK